MARRGYVALAWRAGGEELTQAADAATGRLDQDPRWRRAADLPGLRLWMGAGAALPVRRLPSDAGLLVGDYTEQASLPARAGAPEGWAVALSRSGWGAYVALFVADAAGPSLFRDPSGRLDAVMWRLRSGVTLMTSEPTLLPAGLSSPDLSLDWDRIWRFLAAPATCAFEPLFGGVEAAVPGDLLRLAERGAVRTAIWRPATFASAAIDAAAAAPELVHRVDEVVARMLAPHRRVIMEVSGGLDSAIVSAAVAATGSTDRIVQWLNRAGEAREADERRFARAVTDRLGVALTVSPRRPVPLTEEDLTALASRFWPAMGAMDAPRDHDDVERSLATGATAVLSGEGGDAAFFQMPSALVVADGWDRDGWRVLRSSLPTDIARRTRQSVWQVLQQARRARRGGFARPGVVSPYVAGSQDAAGLAHPWAVDAAARGVSLAKQLQVTGLATAHLFPGQSRRREVAEPLYPLFSQPVMELCLAIPAPDLAGGSYDRPYARRAFADRLPEAVRNRRAKGNLGGYYGRLVALSLPVLRPFLLDGCLARAGLLNLGRLDAALSAERLIWGERPTQLLWLAATEAWVRHWQGRVLDSPHAPRNGPAA